MAMYYLDTSIYIDYYENRKDKFRPLGDWAHRLLALIEANDDVLLISAFVISELEKHFSEKEVKDILNNYKGVLYKIEFTEKQYKEARKICSDRKIPLGDALHAIIARDENAILVTRDKHFEKLSDIVECRRPEDII